MELWKPENGDEDQQEERSEESDPDPHSMDVDVDAETHEFLNGQREEENGDIDDDDDDDHEEDDEDGENPANVAMVPIADMLNARYGSENVITNVCDLTSYAERLAGQAFL